VTGTASNLGRDIADGSWALGAFALMLLVTFYLGAFISGVLVELGRRRQWESIYVLPMALEGVLLFFFGVGLEIWHGRIIDQPHILVPMTGIASLAMGLQNATITRISSGVVRTTHVSGVLTDLGIETALFSFWLWDKRRLPQKIDPGVVYRALRGNPSVRRLLLLGAITGVFIMGACLGTMVYALMPRWAMLPPVIFLAWIVIQDVWIPIAEIEASDLTDANGVNSLHPGLAIFHIRKSRDRDHARNRMPDIYTWATNLPPQIQVVILHLDHHADFDRDTARDLREVMRRLRREGRRLIVSGLNEREVAKLKRADEETLEASDVCPDLEMALLHALILLPPVGDLDDGSYEPEAPPEPPQSTKQTQA
jgi:uncharacterized membrane protein YoaK (UPF0700 family)